MRAFFDPAQQAHHPQFFLVNGVVQPSLEVPLRAEILHAGATAAGCRFEVPADHGLAPIAAVHSAEYLTFLRTIHRRWTRIKGAAPEVVPNVHPVRRTDSYPRSAVGQAGYHMADTACPIGPATWAAACRAAHCALSAAQAVAGGARMAYALCRPPGHHAFGDLAGGFCFLNNAAIAAQALGQAGHRVAVLDVDVHHGNGTQGIFHARSDVLTVSIHADPARFYPFFQGHAHERGRGAGLGANLNLPLARGTGDKGYLVALDTALQRIRDFGTDVVVVALGLDASAEDPFRGLAVTRDGFARIGERIATLGKGLVIVQEGGYVSDALGNNLTRFLTGAAAA